MFAISRAREATLVRHGDGRWGGQRGGGAGAVAVALELDVPLEMIRQAPCAAYEKTAMFGATAKTMFKL